MVMLSSELLTAAITTATVLSAVFLETASGKSIQGVSVSGCTDRKNRWKIGDETRKWCAWASKKPSRCKNRVLYNNCPITCDSCPSMTPSAEPTSSTSTTLPCCGSLLGTMDDVERKINSMDLTISDMNLTINSMEMTINSMAQEMQEMKETMNTMLKYLVPTQPPSSTPSLNPSLVATEKATTKSPTAYPTTQEPTENPPFVTLADGIMYDLMTEEPLYHDGSHFTQGLTYSKKSDILFESNGLYRQSSLCRLDPSTGKALLCKKIESNLFAEGMQVYTNTTASDDNERLIQITWKASKGFIYDATTLERISEFTFSTTRNEGWGICYDEANNEFIVSDGSNVLHFWDAVTLQEKRRVEVYRHSGARANEMNELEFVNGKVLANVWYQDVILVIDPLSGVCESEYDFSQLWPKRDRQFSGADVLNGISISKDDGILYITGKKWNRMYKLKLRNF